MTAMPGGNYAVDGRGAFKSSLNNAKKNVPDASAVPLMQRPGRTLLLYTDMHLCSSGHVAVDTGHAILASQNALQQQAEPTQAHVLHITARCCPTQHTAEAVPETLSFISPCCPQGPFLHKGRKRPQEKSM